MNKLKMKRQLRSLTRYSQGQFGYLDEAVNGKYVRFDDVALVIKTHLGIDIKDMEVYVPPVQIREDDF